MEPLTIETFNSDMIKAVNSEQKRAGDINYTYYLGSTKSITLSVEEILVKEMNTMESYFDDESDSEESDSEEDE